MAIQDSLLEGNGHLHVILPDKFSPYAGDPEVRPATHNTKRVILKRLSRGDELLLLAGYSVLLKMPASSVQTFGVILLEERAHLNSRYFVDDSGTTIMSVPIDQP